MWFSCLGHWFSRHSYGICMGIGWSAEEHVPAPPVGCISSSVASPQTITCKTCQWWQSCHCWWESPNMCHPLEWFCKIWSHPTGFLVKMHKHFAVQGLHFQQKLRFQQQSHGRHHWLLVVFPLNKSGPIVVLMPWTLIFKTFIESAWELVNLPRSMWQPHQLLHFKHRGITTYHHVQDTNGDSLVIVGGHPLTCASRWE